MESIDLKSYRHKNWYSLRQEILKRDNYTCQKCGRTSEEVCLQVHHLEYIEGRKAWEYPSYNFITMCKGCHAANHGHIMPKDGWEYIGMDDLEDLSGECDRCGSQLRYQHCLYHPLWGYINVGASCADTLLEGEVASAKERQLKKLAEKYKRYVNSSRWKYEENCASISLDRHHIKIWTIEKHYILEIECFYFDKDNNRNYIPKRSNIQYESLDAAKDKAFEVITSGTLLEYMQKKYGYDTSNQNIGQTG